MLKTPEGAEVVRYFRERWPGIPREHIYYRERFLPEDVTTWPPPVWQVSALHAPPYTEDSSQLQLREDYTCRFDAGVLAQEDRGGYDAGEFLVPQITDARTIEAWRFKKIPVVKK